MLRAINLDPIPFKRKLLQKWIISSSLKGLGLVYPLYLRHWSGWMKCLSQHCKNQWLYHVLMKYEMIMLICKSHVVFSIVKAPSELCIGVTLYKEAVEWGSCTLWEYWFVFMHKTVNEILLRLKRAVPQHTSTTNHSYLLFAVSTERHGNNNKTTPPFGNAKYQKHTSNIRACSI